MLIHHSTSVVITSLGSDKVVFGRGSGSACILRHSPGNPRSVATRLSIGPATPN